MSSTTVRTPVRRYRTGGFTSRPDTVAGEEPLQIGLGGRPLTVTMRTPGADIDLMHGWLYAEGLITEAADVVTARYCDGRDSEGRNTYNVLDVELARPPDPAALAGAVRRNPTSSACGVCGKTSIEDLSARVRHPIGAGPRLAPDTVTKLPEELRAGQRAFAATGGVHAAALVDEAGGIAHLREDVGRHNAVDKVIGAALRAGELPLHGTALLTSSRASFELVQKALLAGIGMLIAVSAPSSLAVELADTAGMTLIGFTRPTGFNLYCGPQRVEGAV